MNSIDFKLLVDLFPRVTKQKYLMKGGQTPCQPKGVSLKADRVGDETINCTQFTTWIISQAFETTWTPDQWSCWQVSGKAAETGQVPNFGPRVTMEWGIGSTHPGSGPWLVQYFTNPKTFAGHSMLIIAHDKETDKILTLEANRSYGLDGVGGAEIGNLRDVINPGPNWMDKVSQTWTSRLGGKPALHITQLSIEPESIDAWLNSESNKKELAIKESASNNSENWLTVLLSFIVNILSKRKS